MNQKDRFAELMSEGIGFVDICDRMGIEMHDAQFLLSQILQDLGEQAQ